MLRRRERRGEFGEALYDAEQRGELPEAAALASLGCGNPTAVAELHEGETVLDLGSGGGIDVILSAKRVGPTGVAYGLDMTDEMLALARRNAREAGVTNVHLPEGRDRGDPAAGGLGRRRDLELRDQPLRRQGRRAGRDRARAEAGRADRRSATSSPRITSRPRERAERGSYVGCIAGALSKGEYEAGLEAAGFEDVSVEFTHEVADGMHGAIVKAVKTREPASEGTAGDPAGRSAPAAAEGRPRLVRSRSGATCSCERRGPTSRLCCGRRHRLNILTGCVICPSSRAVRPSPARRSPSARRPSWRRC